jgi:hypothetical protein
MGDEAALLSRAISTKFPVPGSDTYTHVGASWTSEQPARVTIGGESIAIVDLLAFLDAVDQERKR